MTFGAYFRSLAVVHLALTIGQLVFGGMALFATHSPGFSTSGKRGLWPTAKAGLDDTGFYAGLVLALAVLATTHFIFRRRVAAAREQRHLSDILMGYRRSVILRDAIANATGLFATLAFLLTGHVRFVSITGLVVLVFLVWWPTREKSLLLLGLEDDPRVADPTATIGASD
jgi:hypothetical protein